MESYIYRNVRIEKKFQIEQNKQKICPVYMKTIRVIIFFPINKIIIYHRNNFTSL